MLLADCGQLPRPFQPEDKVADGLLAMQEQTESVVLQVAGGGGTGDALAAEMAARLRAAGVPAITGDGDPGSRRIQGHAAIRPLPRGREEVLLYWELRHGDGSRGDIHTQRREPAAGAWATATPDLIADLAEAAAPALVAMVREPATGAAGPEPAAYIPGFPGARLVILPMSGGPGDAAESLPMALEYALDAARVPVAERIADNDLLVQGDVEAAPAANGTQTIAVRWSVRSARDGRELGTIAQKNLVPAGSLDGPWGPVAEEIARAAASGLRDLLEQAGKL